MRYLESLLAGDGVKALSAIREASALAPGGRADYNVAMTALSVGRSELALQTLRGINPDRGAVKGWAPYWYALSHAHHLQGNYAAELDVSRELRRRHPESRAGWVHFVRAHAALGNIAGIDSALAEASALPPATYWSQGAMLVTAAEELGAHAGGRGAASYYRRAGEWLGNQLARNPDHRAHRFWMGTSLYGQGKYADAEPYFESLVTDFPDDLQFRGTLALIAARAGHQTRAHVLLGEIPQYERGEYLSYQARVAAIQGDRERAIALWSEALGSGRSGLVWIHTAARRDILSLADDERFQRLGIVP